MPNEGETIKTPQTFSQREGFQPFEHLPKGVHIDKTLRTDLWNLIVAHCGSFGPHHHYTYQSTISDFVASVWTEKLHRRLDHFDSTSLGVYDIVIKHYFSCQWYEVFDFIEFLIEHFRFRESRKKQFIGKCNHLLRTRLSEYGIVSGKFVKVASEQERIEIDKAVETPYAPVQIHIKRALDLLSKRKNPDPRNSIKESISAVEAACQQITGTGSTLGDALRKIEQTQSNKLSQPLRDAFSKLYGFTNSEGGIRHALLDDSEADFVTARFMLVSCSAFVNYLFAKSEI